MNAHRQALGRAVNACVNHHTAARKRSCVAALWEELCRAQLPCVGEPCDLDAPCSRHRNMYSISQRLVDRRLAGL